MGGLGHSEVSSTWGIPSPSYINSSGCNFLLLSTGHVFSTPYSRHVLSLVM
jgi:hypothetical protein